MAQARKRRTPVAVSQVKKTLLQTKAIVTNLSALKKKYGVAGGNQLIVALDALVAADASRGVTSAVHFIDDAHHMQSIGGRAITAVTDQSGTKQALDAVAANSPGASLLLVGAHDVITFQHLTNPLFASHNDSDQDVPSDLPYACTSPYSTDIGDFIAPTRAVTRIPDVVGGTDPRYLLTCLGLAASATSRSPRDYSTALVISAAVWKVSTRNTAQTLFGNSVVVEESPAAGPPWSSSKLARRFHFINCHGARSASQFFGQNGSSYPAAFDAADLPTRITPGAVVAAECCYGAQLYDPALSALSICSTYLREGAYAFCGSTNIAYGPAGTPNGYADLICRFFIEEIQLGAAVGDALMHARTRYVALAGALDPIGLKTLAQFVAYGDVTLRPVQPGARRATALAHSLPGGGRPGDAASKGPSSPSVLGRLAGRPPNSVTTQFEAIGSKLGRTILASSTFESSEPEHSGEVFAKSFASRAPHRRVHIASAVIPDTSAGVELQRGVLLVAIEENGEIIGPIQEVWQK